MKPQPTAAVRNRSPEPFRDPSREPAPDRPYAIPERELDSPQLDLQFGLAPAPLRQRIHARVMWRLGKVLQLNVLSVYRRPLSGEHSIPGAIARRYEFRELGGEELMSFANNAALNLSRRFVAEALMRGDRCFGVLAAGKLVAYHWQSLCGYAPCKHGVSVRFDPRNQTYQYKMFTLPEHRGRRLQLYSIGQADSAMRARGYEHTILYVDRHNAASLRALSRVPRQQRVGTAVSMVMFNRHWTLHSGALAKYGFRLVPQTR